MASIEALIRKTEAGKEGEYWRIVDREKLDNRWKKKTVALGFISEKEARRALKIYEGRKAAGDDPLPAIAPPSECPKLKEQWSRLEIRLQAEGRARGTIQLAGWIGRSMLRKLGEYRLDQITTATLDQYLSDRRAEGILPRTLQIEVRHIRKALELAVEDGVLPAVPALKAPTGAAKPHRWLSPAESDALIAALPWHTEPASAVAIFAALEIGCRRGELLSRKWQDIRWDQGQHGSIWIGEQAEIDWTTKTRKGRTIPLSEGLATTLQWWKDKTGGVGWLFPSPHNPGQPLGNFKKALSGACKRAGVQGIHPHALRHSWATRLAMRGVPKAITMALGGWRTPDVLEGVYQHAIDDYSDQAIQAASLGLVALVPQACPSSSKVELVVLKKIG